MAIYHCSIKIIGRSAKSGRRSAIACAAYRSGEKLYSEESQRTFDYRRKGGVEHSEIVLPDDAPERFLDRQTLWNSVQSVENTSNSQLAREFNVALPMECDLVEWITIGRRWAAFLASQGMIVDWSIHNPLDKETGLPYNPHIHATCTTRHVLCFDVEHGAKVPALKDNLMIETRKDENGKVQKVYAWASKQKKVYKLDDKGERVPVVDDKKAAAFKEKHGITYQKALENAENAEERDQIIQEVQKIGKKNRREWQRVVVERNEWDEQSNVVEWRSKWCDIVNDQLEAHVAEYNKAHPDAPMAPIEHIDYRSNLDRGIEQIPTVHEGYKARNLDKELMQEKGIHAEVVQKNIDIRKQNELIRTLHELIRKLQEKAGEIYERYKEQIREIGRSGSIFDRIRNAITNTEYGKSGVASREPAFKHREREANSIIKAAQRREREAGRREQKALGTESTINRAAETISRREEQRREIEKSWYFHGSKGTNLDGVYEAIGQKLISEHDLSIMNEYQSVGWDRYEYDHRFKVQVFIIKPSDTKKADKVLQKNEHIMIPVVYEGKDMVAVVCKQDEYYFRDKVKSVAADFYLYADHKIPEKQTVTTKKPNLSEKLKDYTELSKQRELKKTKSASHEKSIDNRDDFDIR